MFCRPVYRNLFGQSATLVVLLLMICIVMQAQYSTKKVIVQGKGMPVVLLAGGRWDMQSFSGPAKALSKNHLVIRMEHFNVDYADRDVAMPNGYSLQKESEAIARTLDSLGIHEKVSVIGWSFGALLALDFALNHPNQVHKLVLYEPPAFWVARECKESPPGMKEMIKLTRKFEPNSKITDEQMANFFCLLNNCNPDTLRNQPQWSKLINQKKRLRGLAIVATHNDSLKRLQSYQGSVLVLTGIGTPPFHRRINELLVRELPDAKLSELSGGHSAPLVALERFVKIVKEFLGTP